MTSKQQDNSNFLSELIAEKTELGMVLRIYSNRIFYVTIPRYEKIGMHHVKVGYEFLEANGGGKFHNIYQFDSFSDIEPEVRVWAADNNGNQYTFSDAIVIKSLSQKIIADFYLRFNKPAKPTKIFYAMDKAIDWTNQQINLR